MLISPNIYYFAETRDYLKLQNRGVTGKLYFLSEQMKIQSSYKTAPQWGKIIWLKHPAFLGVRCLSDNAQDPIIPAPSKNRQRKMKCQQQFYDRRKDIADVFQRPNLTQDK